MFKLINKCRKSEEKRREKYITIFPMTYTEYINPGWKQWTEVNIP